MQDPLSLPKVYGSADEKGKNFDINKPPRNYFNPETGGQYVHQEYPKHLHALNRKGERIFKVANDKKEEEAAIKAGYTLDCPALPVAEEAVEAVHEAELDQLPAAISSGDAVAAEPKKAKKKSAKK